MSATKLVSRMTPEERREFARLVQIAGTLPMEHLLCRLVKHSWKPIPVDYEAPFGRPLAFQCTRCGTKRYDCYDVAWGFVVYRKYVYAEGYLLQEEDTGRNVRMPMDVIRAAYGKRIDA